MRYAQHVPAFGSGWMDMTCTDCGWELPRAVHCGTGTGDRPPNADDADRLFPVLSAHIDATGHSVRCVLTTNYDGVVETSRMLFSDGVEGG